MSKLSISKLKPLAGYVLVEPSKQETKTKSGIILTEADIEKPQYGKVLAIGESKSEDCCGGGCCDDIEASRKSDCEVKVGDMVIYKKWGGSEVAIDDVEYQFLKCEDILAIIKI